MTKGGKSRPGLPRHEIMARQAARLRFESTAAFRIPHFRSSNRVRRPLEIKKEIEKQVRAIAVTIPKQKRTSFFRRYRTLVTGRIHALEIAQEVFQKHAEQLESPEYRVQRKAIAALRNELVSTIGEKNALPIMKMLIQKNVIVPHEIPVYRSEAAAYAMVSEYENFALTVIRRMLPKKYRRGDMNTTVLEMYQDIIPQLVQACQRYNEKTMPDFDSYFAVTVGNRLRDRLREAGRAEGYQQRRGKIATIVSLDQLAKPKKSKRKIKDAFLDEKGARRREVRELRDMLQVAIGKLPEQDQRILYSHYVIGDTMKEIGKREGVSESQISKLEERARERLRKLLKEYNP